MTESNRYFINLKDFEPADGSHPPQARYRMGQYATSRLPHDIWDEPVSDVPFSVTTLIEWTGVDDGDEIHDMLTDITVVVGKDICRLCGSPDEVIGALCVNCAEAEWTRQQEANL